MSEVKLPFRLTLLFTLTSILLVVLLGTALYLELTRDWSRPLYAVVTNNGTAGQAAGDADPELISRGQALFQERGCVACHTANGRGGGVGPDLAGVTARRELAWLQEWLADPPAVKPGTLMPNLGLGTAEIDALIAYLESLE